MKTEKLKQTKACNILSKFNPYEQILAINLLNLAGFAFLQCGLTFNRLCLLFSPGVAAPVSLNAGYLKC